MCKIVIADSSCLIGLSKIKRLNLLYELFEEILIPKAVFQEVVLQGENRKGCIDVKNANWIKTQSVKNDLAVSILSKTLGFGESEAMVLTTEKSADFLILDDGKARKIAKEMDLPIIGTIGILMIAEKKKLIQSAKAELLELNKIGFRCNINLLNK